MIEDVSTRAATALKAGEIEPAEALTIIGNDLRDAYFFRLREALNGLEEVVQNGFASRATEWAGQARGYAHLLASDFAAKLGDTSAATLAETLTDLEAAALAEDWATTADKLAEVRSLLADYSPVELNPAELAKRGQLLYLFTDLAGRGPGIGRGGGCRDLYLQASEEASL